MSRINSNVPSMVARRVLGQNNLDLNNSLERLSTGLRINRGKDDPAGLIASQNLRKDIAGTRQAIANAERADQVVNIAEGGLDEISSMLTEVQSLITQTANEAGLSREEKEANQLQIDSILQTIDRIAGATSFQGKKLLNGSLDYTAETVSTVIDSYKVNGAKLQYNDTRDVDVLVTASAQLAGYFLSFGGTALDLAAANSQFTVEIAGSLGSRELTFSSGTALTDVIATINTFKDVTGVSAQAGTAGTNIKINSTDYGTNEFVKVKVVDNGGLAGTTGIYDLSGGDANNIDSGSSYLFNATAAANGVQDDGQDVEATINGIQAVTNGTNVAINTDFLNVSIDLKYDLANASAATLGNINAFQITGGGADFQLAGNVDIAGKVSLGIQNVAARTIGKQQLDTVGGAGQTFYFLKDLSAGSDLNVVDGDIDKAQRVVTQAIKDVSSLRGRLGAFQQNTIGSTIRSLGVALENTTAAESVIRDADFASETSALTRAQILSQSATSSLQQANTTPQAALTLLG